jgi:CHAD domain-containing protein
MTQPGAKGTFEATTVRDELSRYIEAAVKSIRARAPTDAQIHHARKNLKRARAHLRLLRDAVGHAAYRRENAALRDAARPLSGVRDAAVLCHTADRLIRAARRGPRRVLLKMRRALNRGRLEAREELRVMNAVEASIARLKAAVARIRGWHLTRVDSASLRSGLERTYRRTREACAIACEDPTNENLHEWRKQVKYLAQSLEVWETHGANDVKRLVKRADRLADRLGTDHDLAVFEARLVNLDAPHPVLPAITHTIADQRGSLLDKALKKGRRFFKPKPRSFMRRIAQLH